MIGLNIFKSGSSQNGRFSETTEGRELSSQNSKLPFKTGELEHIQKGRQKWIWSICHGWQLTVFKWPGKYINSTKTVITKSISCGGAVPLLTALLLWISEWNFTNGKYKCSRVHCSILYNRFLELKKKLEGKFSKPSAKNFKIWLSSLKETFLDATNTSDMHSDDLNFVSSKRGWFFRNGKMDSFQKGKIFTFWK